MFSAFLWAYLKRSFTFSLSTISLIWQWHTSIILQSCSAHMAQREYSLFYYRWDNMGLYFYTAIRIVSMPPPPPLLRNSEEMFLMEIGNQCGIGMKLLFIYLCHIKEIRGGVENPMCSNSSIGFFVGQASHFNFQLVVLSL